MPASKTILKTLAPLVAALGVAFMGFLARAETPLTRSMPQSVRWRLDDTACIAGMRPEVLGTPKVEEMEGGKSLRFDGKGDGLILATNPLSGWDSFTIEVLIRPESGGDAEQRFLHIEDGQGRRAMIETRMIGRDQWVLDTFLRATAEHSLTLIDRAKRHPADRWHWVALVYDGHSMTNHVDGVMEVRGGVRLPVMEQGRTSIGVRQNRIYWYKGSMGEIRFHPRALDAGELQRCPEELVPQAR